MPKNRSNRQARIARQRKARAARSQAQHTDVLTAFTEACASGFFPMAGADGETRRLPVARIAEWHNEGLARDGEPPLERGELTSLLADDLMFGRLRLRPDGLWESDDDYFTAGSRA